MRACWICANCGRSRRAVKMVEAPVCATCGAPMSLELVLSASDVERAVAGCERLDRRLRGDK